MTRYFATGVCSLCSKKNVGVSLRDERQAIHLLKRGHKQNLGHDFHGLLQIKVFR